MASTTARARPSAAFLARNRHVVRLAAPFLLVAFLFGASFGVLARDAGMGVAAPIVMSLTTFAGSAQFAAVSILSTGGGLTAAVLAAVLLNARYAPIGLSVAHVIRGGRLSRALQAQLVVDESWALANEGGRSFDGRVLIGVGIALYIGWNSGTALGVLSGDLLGDPETLGLDAAFPALFLALLVSQLDSPTARLGALGGAAIALALIPFSQPGLPIIAACAACAIAWRRSP